mmetsp:Transcript_5634/g.12470  ORF Transcript_5634/g.12470 Transcript_5634/m.12470 type:complete len:272 (+) Transcript_5634:210-1025(+)|eukprot:CAMPEP_0202901622 /NCGR_PEP_ID=MMETSP1392-20130828/14359_1 /ASSEMBLY_ACC=CAM_ASM_000868 /TAXON_ID=225041 /ORGANISM="Chlamydomonas chlamydogama, Strain SAG 11-48b" /LENGTH=271 /DNA_ID=CAMNT_0049588211 /DNA_START=216 /DNA_END=1031 /DNA_ORIENTATION=+
MAQDAVQVDIRPEGYAILTLQKEPVNSLDLSTWDQLERALDSLEANTSVSGVIIASGLKRDIFSAGNDLMELYAPKTSQERYTQFWIVSNRFLAKLHRSRLATIAAVRGACPAGGCAIALCCDHRVMTTQGTIGLNEVQLGIPVPKFWGILMANLIGRKAADKLLLTGKLASPQEAKSLGLVDEVVPKEQLLPAAEKVMQQLVRLPSHAVGATKQSLRAEFSAQWEEFAKVEPRGAWKFLNEPATLQTLAGVLERLSSSSKKGAGAATSKL